MKKLLIILGMVFSIGLVGCGQSGTPAEQSQVMDTEQAKLALYNYFSFVGDAYDNKTDIDANAAYYESYIGVTADVMKAAVDSYSKSVDEIDATWNGEVEEASCYLEGDVLYIKGTLLTDSGKKLEQELSFEKKSGRLIGSVTNVIYSFGELMVQAALNTLLGLGTVFVVLFLLWGVISCFKFISGNNNEKKTENTASQKTEDKVVEQIVENEAVNQEDTELIAVIAAAIAAAEGSASPDEYVVRSIRRRY